MADKVQVYSPDRVLFIFAGLPMSGFGEGSMIAIEPDTDRVTHKVSADGDVALARSANRVVQLTAIFLQTSQSNDLLMSILEADTQRGTISLVPALIQDLSGRTNFISSRAWIKREPNVVFGREVEEREWMIGAVPSTYFIGGNQ